ncbi:MAG: methyltransferase domain-containing protein [Chloroflexi bacterium]|nr:methyltransferase domain-containing protein [Chloroflexota bacterium]
MTVNIPAFWEEIYQNGRAGWDLGGATPIFKRLLDSGKFAPGKIIVLGAGRGHDAREFARRGFAVTAVDFSLEAVRDMRARDDPKIPVAILQHDIFDLPRALNGIFDYVLEYTCFCAIDPKRRGEYADVVARLLKPGGKYIALAFPLDRHDGGPPFSVTAEEILKLFQARDFQILRREIPSDSVSQRKGLEELLILEKKIIYELRE